MAIAYNGEAQKVYYGTNTTVATTDGINVALGNLIIVGLCTDDDSAAGYPTDLADTAGNVFSLCELVSYGNSSLLVGYCLSATHAHAANMFTGTYTAVGCNKSVWAVVFTPDVGDTVSLDFSEIGGQAASEDSPWETGAGNITGDDAVAIGFFYANGPPTFANQAIGGGAVTVLTPADTRGTYFYRIYSATANGVAATTDITTAKSNSDRILVFKSVAAAGSIVPLLMSQYRRRRA